METENAWVLVVNSGGLRGGRFVMSLILFLSDTLKASHASNKIEFIRRGKNIPSHTSTSSITIHYCEDTSILHSSNYHWYGHYQSRLNS